MHTTNGQRHLYNTKNILHECMYTAHVYYKLLIWTHGASVVVYTCTCT